MIRILRAFFDGIRLTCPNCHRGRMFSSYFQMHQCCPICHLPFEEASGEITGGMGVNIVVTLFLVITSAAVVGFSDLPVVPALLVLIVFFILFPILFYPFSRAVWMSLLYLTGDHREPDQGRSNRD